MESRWTGVETATAALSVLGKMPTCWEDAEWVAEGYVVYYLLRLAPCREAAHAPKYPGTFRSSTPRPVSQSLLFSFAFETSYSLFV
jgi:hypothetical protein